MREPDDETKPTETKSRGLAITAVAIGASGLTPAVATSGGLADRPAAGRGRVDVYSWVAQAFVLGARRAVVRVAADQRADSGLLRVRRRAHHSGPGRIGAALGVLTILLVVSGVAVFATMSWHNVGPSTAYFDTQQGG